MSNLDQGEIGMEAAGAGTGEQRPAAGGRAGALAVLLAVAAGAVVMLLEQVPWVRGFLIGWTQSDLGAPWRGGFSWPADSVRGLLVAAVCFALISGGGYFILTATRWLRRALPSLGERMLLAPLAGAVPASLLVLINGLIGGIGVARPLQGALMWLIFSAFGVGCLVRSVRRRRRVWGSGRGARDAGRGRRSRCCRSWRSSGRGRSWTCS